MKRVLMFLCLALCACDLGYGEFSSNATYPPPDAPPCDSVQDDCREPPPPTEPPTCIQSLTYEVDAAMARTVDGYTNPPSYNGYNWHMFSIRPLRYPFQTQIGDTIHGWRLKWYNSGNAVLTGQLQKVSHSPQQNGAFFSNIGAQYVLTTAGSMMEIAGLNEPVLHMNSFSIYVTSTGQSGNYTYNAELLISRIVPCPPDR